MGQHDAAPGFLIIKVLQRIKQHNPLFTVVWTTFLPRQLASSQKCQRQATAIPRCFSATASPIIQQPLAGAPIVLYFSFARSAVTYCLTCKKMPTSLVANAALQLVHRKSVISGKPTKEECFDSECRNLTLTVTIR